MFDLINLSWIVALIGVVLIFLLPVKLKAITAIIVILTNSFITGWLAVLALTGEISKITLWGGSVMGNLNICIDPLSAWFILIINFTSISGGIFGSGYLKAYNEPSKKLTLHWILFVIFHFSMIWVCMIQHGLMFLIAWELMSLSSMLLVIFDHQNPMTLKAGINYLVQMHLSIAFLTVGFIWVNFQTGSFSFDTFNIYFGQNSNLWLFLIFFIGFGLKAGFIPFHTWLPHAHPAAPSHISGIMSGVIVKLGIYGIFRIISYLSNDYLLLGEILITVSVLTGLFGIINASVHRDFKKMLAYCTIENIGIIGIGIGLGLVGLGKSNPTLYFLGFGGALLHTLNHSLFKSLLFYSIGSVYQQTHTRDMEKLGGLIKLMPRTAFTFLIGALAIGGLPPFNGFISEFVIYSGLIEGIQMDNASEIILFVLTLAGLSLIGGLSILTFTKSFGVIFLGSQRQELVHKPHEVSFLMLFPQYMIIAVILAVSIFSGFIMEIIEKILNTFNISKLNFELSSLSNQTETLRNISIYSLILILVILIIWGIRTLAVRNKPALFGPTWGCGYSAANTRQQYTGKSFSKSLGKMFNFILLERKKFNELNSGDIFPKERRYTSHYQDFFEENIISNITKRLLNAVNYFKFVQNGRIQSYVLYGIVFVLAIFLLTIFNVVS